MFCKNCGKELNDNAKFCPNCGTPAAPEDDTENGPAPEMPAEETLPVDPGVYTADQGTSGTSGIGSDRVYSEKEDAEEFTSGQRRAVTRIVSIISYFGIWFLIPALVFKDKPYIRQHANNGLVLLIFSAGAALVCVIPIIGWIAGAVIGTFTSVLSVIGIIQAACGHNFSMPILGGIKILK